MTSMFDHIDRLLEAAGPLPPWRKPEGRAVTAVAPVPPSRSLAFPGRLARGPAAPSAGVARAAQPRHRALAGLDRDLAAGVGEAKAWRRQSDRPGGAAGRVA